MGWLGKVILGRFGRDLKLVKKLVLWVFGKSILERDKTVMRE